MTRVEIIPDIIDRAIDIISKTPPSKMAENGHSLSGGKDGPTYCPIVVIARGLGGSVVMSIDAARFLNQRSPMRLHFLWHSLPARYDRCSSKKSGKASVLSYLRAQKKVTT